jgi:hypothetical protein
MSKSTFQVAKWLNEVLEDAARPIRSLETGTFGRGRSA